MISHPIGSALFAVLAGLLLGSFLNVCIARLPQHRSIAWPGSHCPRCSTPIRPWDNVPLVSFLLLGGRCRSCRQRIALRYPLVEVGLALLFLLSVERFPLPATVARLAVLCFVLLGLLVMDAETFRLPDTFTLPGIALGLVQAGLGSGATGPALAPTLDLLRTAPFSAPHEPAWLVSIAGAAGAASFLLAVRWVYWLVRHQEGMGLGDVKLAALLGAWLGVTGVVLTLALAVFLAAAVGVGLIALRRRLPSRQRLPFGSFLCGGGLLTLFYGQAVLIQYFRLWR